MVVAEAASCAGVSITVAWRWFRHVGGVMPPDFSSSPQPVTVRRLSLGEREEIACRRAASEGVRAIAVALGRSPSTISRELRRGTVRRKSGYRATVAQALADQRSRRPKARVLERNDRLRERPRASPAASHGGARTQPRRSPGARVLLTEPASATCSGVRPWTQLTGSRS